MLISKWKLIYQQNFPYNKSFTRITLYYPNMPQILSKYRPNIKYIYLPNISKRYKSRPLFFFWIIVLLISDLGAPLNEVKFFLQILIFRVEFKRNIYSGPLNVAPYCTFQGEWRGPHVSQYSLLGKNCINMM